MKRKGTYRKSPLWAVAATAAFLAFAGCSIVLTQDVGGTSSGAGGVLDPMLEIFERELAASYDASRSITPIGARGLAGGANSILHGLPATTVAKVRARVRERIAASGLEKSRDLEKVGPAIVKETAEALKDPLVVGSSLAESELAAVNAVASRAVAKSFNTGSVTAIAEGRGSEAEKTTRLERLAERSSENVVALGFASGDVAADALQKLVLAIVETGNADVSPTGSGDQDPKTILTSRVNSLVRIAASSVERLSSGGSPLLSGSACASALNGLANAAIVALGGTAIASAEAAKLQAVVQDGVLAGLFIAYYQYTNNLGLSANLLKSNIDFTAAIDALGAGTPYAQNVATNIQAAKSTLVAAADSTALKATVIDTANPPVNELVNATQAASVASLENKTWTAGSWLVTSSVTISGNLTIAAGATIYMKSGCNLVVASTGTLKAVGTATAPIVFKRADAGNAWGAIRINSNGSAANPNKLEYCDISGASIGVQLAYDNQAGIADISNCVLHDNGANGLNGVNAKTDQGRLSRIRNCYFYANGDFPAAINQYVDLDGSNHFYNPALRNSPDPAAKKNAIAFSGNVNSNIRLSCTEVPYWIGASWYVGDSVTGSSLSLGPGVVLKFASGVRMRIYNASSLFTEGSLATPVVFTSANDDRLGDTNGTSTAALAGDWVGIDIMSSENTITGCEFAYAQSAIFFNDYASGTGRAVVQDSSFHDCYCTGFDGQKALPGTQVTTSHFWQNSSWPVYINHNVVFPASNHFYSRGSTAVDPQAKFNAVVFSGNVNSANPVNLAISEVPYCFLGSWYIGDSVASTVSIAPGAVLKFALGAKVRFYYGSTIQAPGTTAARIVFTSLNDDTGGDSNGSAAAAAAGDWGGMDIMSSGNVFANSDFAYADSAVHFNLYSFKNGAAAFSGCRFHHCSTAGFDGANASGASSVAGSYFWAHTSYPVYINHYVAFDATNHFHAPDAAAADPAVKYNAVVFSGNVNCGGELSLPVTEVPYYFPASWYLGDTLGSKIVLAPGAVLKFALGAKMRVYYGSAIDALGSSSAPIVFTSVNDDQLGDTNGMTGAPAPGSWNGIDLMSLSGSCAFDRCRFSYATTPLYFNYYSNQNGGGTIRNSEIIHNSAGGIDASAAGPGTVIAGNSFSDNNANGSTLWDLYINGNANVAQSGNSATYIKP